MTLCYLKPLFTNPSAKNHCRKDALRCTVHIRTCICDNGLGKSQLVISRHVVDLKTVFAGTYRGMLATRYIQSPLLSFSASFPFFGVIVHDELRYWSFGLVRVKTSPYSSQDSKVCRPLLHLLIASPFCRMIP